MFEAIVLINRIAKLRERADAVESRLETVAKESPTASDVHVPSAMGGKKKIKKEEDALEAPDKSADDLEVGKA